MDFGELLKPVLDQPQQQQSQGANGVQADASGGGAAAGVDPTGGDNSGSQGGQGAAGQQQPQQGQQGQQGQQQQQPTNTDNATGAPAGGDNQDSNFFVTLDRMSGGRFKDETGFRSALDQLGEYPTLKQNFEELSARMAEVPKFANDEVRIYNELIQGGATREKVNTFLQLNQLGDLKELSDKDALIAYAVMVKDSKQTAASLRVERDYKLNDESLTPEERELLDDDMRVAGADARKELAKFKAEVSSTQQHTPEEVRLQNEARLLAHQSQVKPYARDVVAAIPHMGDFTMVAGKDGQEAVKYQIPMDDTTRTTLAQHVENYFLDGTTPINEQTTREALSYAWAEHFRVNAQKILSDVYNDAVTKTTEKLVAKYENRSGVDGGQDRPLVGAGNDAKSMAQFMTGVANRNVGG